MEVTYFQAFIDGVDFVFIESPMFRHIENNIYGGNRMVRYLFLYGYLKLGVYYHSYWLMISFYITIWLQFPFSLRFYYKSLLKSWTFYKKH